jgi:RNA polymerase sigma-70 factor (ECF subfamily)
MGDTLGRLIPFRRPAPSTDALSDEAMLAACGMGDQAALGLLFDRYGRDIYRFLGRMRGADQPDLEDLLQSTFVEVVKSSGRFRRGSSVRTWLFAIAANVARNHVRSEVRRRGSLANLEQLPNRGPELPSEIAERRQLLGRIQHALGTMAEPLRVVLVMCDLEEIPCVDVARALGVREGTIWRRLHDARQAMREAIGGEVP